MTAPGRSVYNWCRLPGEKTHAQATLRAPLGAGLSWWPPPHRASAQILEIGIDQSPAGLDPHLVTAFSSFMIVNGTIYEGLTAIDKDLNVVPGLAESWTVSPDGKTYTFKLRSGRELPRRLADGRRRRRVDDQARAERRRSPRRWRAASRRVESATAVDPQTVELKLKEPSAPLLASLATIAIVPSSVETNKDALAEAAGRHRPVQVHRNGSRTASSCSSQARRLLASRARRSSPA